MPKFTQSALSVGALLLAASSVQAQQVISAKAGLVHYVEGDVFIKEQLVEHKRGDFNEMKAGEVLRTGLGRAEVLLTPGTVLRVAENSAFKLVTTNLEDVNVELLDGSVLLEVAEPNKETSVRLKLGEATVAFEKRGVYRLDVNPALVRVYDGQAEVLSAGQALTVKEGKRMLLTGALTTERFDKEKGDAFHRWAGRRSGYLARANMASARTLQTSGWRAGSWYFNPYFGTFTYLPFNSYMSGFGYRYYTPGYYTSQQTLANSGGGWAGASAGNFPSMDSSSGNRTAVYSGGASVGRSAPAASSAPAPAAGGARTGGGGASRGSGGGR